MPIVMGLLQEVSAESELNIPDTTVCLMLVKSGHLLVVYIPTVRGADLKKNLL